LKPPCMIVVQYVLPAIRVLIMRELVEKHGLRKIDASAKMAVSPAAVTQYMKGERGSAFIKEVSQSEKAMQIVSELAEALVKDETPMDTVISKLCEACTIIRSEGINCKLHQKELPALRECKCVLCKHLKH
jgi:predicted transcriptional regulator